MGEPTPKEPIPVWQPPAEDSEDSYELTIIDEDDPGSLIDDISDSLNKMIVDKQASTRVNEIMELLREEDEKLANSIQDVIITFTASMRSKDGIQPDDIITMRKKLEEIKNKYEKEHKDEA